VATGLRLLSTHDVSRPAHSTAARRAKARMHPLGVG
jgi:hypothetical protein